MLQNGALMHRLPALSPHRVFCCRMGRVEVYQPIPAPDGKSPEGPHTHVLPRLLAHGRLNAATVPVPEGWLAGMSLFPAHPLLRADGPPTAFDAARYHAFQSLMEQFGDPALVAGKQAAFATQPRSPTATNGVMRWGSVSASVSGDGWKTRLRQILDAAIQRAKDVAIVGPP